MRWYLLLVFGFLLLLPTGAIGATYTWTGLTLHDTNPYNDSSFWETAANWSPQGVPGTGDDVVKANDDNVLSNGAKQIRSIQFSGGKLTVISLTPTAGGSWTGGYINGAWNIPSGAVLTISGAADKRLDNGSGLVNSGTIVWSGGGPIMAEGYSSPSSITNENGAVFDFAADGTPFAQSANNQVAYFTNKTGAKMVKSAGTGTTSCTIWIVNNAGLLQPQSGTLEFANNTLNLTNGATASGAGTLHLAAAASLSGTFTSSARVLFDGGSLTGSAGTYAGTGIVDWQGGTLDGNLTIQSGARMNVSDPGATPVVKALADSAVLNNKGTITWSGAGSIRASYYSAPSTINNESGGEFNLVNDGTPFAWYSNNQIPIFNNKVGAVLAKTGGTGETAVNVFVVNNTGTLRSDVGTLNFNGSLNLNGGGTISGVGTHKWGGGGGGAFTVTDTTTISSMVVWVGGTVVGSDDGTGTLATSGTGKLDWQSGALSKTVTFNTAGNFLLSGAGMKHLNDGAVLNNKGIVTWSGEGTIRANGYSAVSTINNESGAQWLITGDATMIHSSHNIEAIFNNKLGATVQKNTATGVTLLDAWLFNNAGLAQATTGTLQFGDGGDSTGRFDATAGAAIQFVAGTHTWQNGVKFTGTGKLQVAGGTVNATGTQTCTTTGTGEFEVNSGALNGTGTSGATLAGTGTLKWTGGAFGGFLKIALGSTLTINGSGVKTESDGLLLQNRGNIIWLEGLVSATSYSSPSTVENLSGGVFTFGADGSPFGRVSSNHIPVFNNKVGAKLVKSTGTGATSCTTWTFNNDGAIQVNAGTLEFTGNTLNLANGSTVSGVGTLHLSTTANLTGTLTSSARILLDDGSLSGSAATYTGAGIFDWQGGTLAGDITLAAGAKINASDPVGGPTVKALADGVVLNNKGTITWSGVGLIRASAYSAPSTINNENGGVFALAGDGTPFGWASTNQTPIFNNKAGALLKKTVGAGATKFSIFTLNNGNIAGTTLTAGGEIQSLVGTLEFYNQSNLYGAKFTGAGQTAWRGAVALYGTTTIASTQTNLVEGSLTGVASVGPDALPPPTIVTTGTGALNWTGGTLYGTFNVGTNSLVNLQGNTVKAIADNAVFNNAGTVNLLAGSLIASAYSAPSTFHNLNGATFNATGGTVLDRSSTNQQPVFNNSGLLNLGATGGPLSMGWNYAQTSTGALHTEINSAAAYGQMAAGGSVVLNGALQVQLNGTYVPALNTAFAVLDPPSLLTSIFAGLPEGATLNSATHTFQISYARPVTGGGIDDRVVLTSKGPLPTLSVNDVSVTEGNSGTKNAAFTVTLSPASTQTVTVKYATADGTTNPATAGSDYVAVPLTTLTFTPGQTSKTVNVVVNGDTVVEADETFFVNLSAPTNAGISDARVVGTITNDDLPSLSVNDVSVTEGNSGTKNAAFTVTLSPASTQTVTVKYATADGTTNPATAGSDYVAAPLTTLTFTPGQTSKTVNVVVNGDTVVEADETFFVNLSAPTNASISDAQGLGTITNDDQVSGPGLSINDVTVTEGNTGTKNATFTITLSPASAQEVIVGWETADGTATAGSDYVASATNQVFFMPGETSKTITVVVNGDTVVEANETFFVNLVGAFNATIADGQGIGTITNDDVSGATLSINDVAVLEGNSGMGSVNFTVTLSKALGIPVTVKYATANGSAEAPGDYTATSGTLTIAAGQTRGIITVPIVGDTLDELDETFFVNLSAPTVATISDTQGRGIIVDNDSAPSVTINDVTVTEGDTGTKDATFTVALSTASGQTISINAIPSNGTARTPADYVTGGARLIFAPGETVKTFSVPVKGDLLDEPDETFFVILSSPVNCSIGVGRGTGTIVDNDAPPSITIDDVRIGEGNVGQRTAAFRLKLSAPSGQVVRVSYATGGGTATAGNDYDAVTTTQIAFTTGNIYAYARVLINGDLLNEPNETFNVNLTSPVNATIADAQALGTILNDDSAPSLTINDVSITEGNSGTRNIMTFTVTLSKASGQTVTVKYATADGVARSTSDYVATSGTLTFSAGQTSKTINVTVTGDVVVEGDETLFVFLSSATNASIGRARGVGTILNDDVSG